MILIARPVYCGDQVSRGSDMLLANQNSEVVVSQVHTGVAFGLQCGAEEDEILADRSV